MLERGGGLCQTANLRLVFVQTAAHLGYAYALAGRTAEALPLLEQAIARATSMRFLQNQALWLVYLSEAYLLAERLDEARAHAERALELSHIHKERGSQAWALRLLGETEAHRGPQATEQAAAHYRQALALAEELGMRPLQAHCHHGLGTLYARAGRAEQARTELAAAIALYRAMDMTFWLPLAEAVLARVRG
jgi:tetratricopeptide (TPR) repeat protein